MELDADAKSALAASWVLVGITLIFVVARLYTRIVLIDLYAIDDHIYNSAFALLVAYCITITVAASYGFGRNMTDITNPDDITNAILFEAISQTFEIVGMALAKCSMGFFLLRLVMEVWQMAVIWTCMALLMASSISVCFVFWLSCTPKAYLWNKYIEGGECTVNTYPISMILSVTCIICDFLFAVLPWFFIWNLNMPKREKVVVLSSLSLGVAAAACGVKRTLEVSSLTNPNYLKATVGLIVWSCAELSVTMICIGFAVCRPLYKPYLDRWVSYASNNKSGSNNNLSGSNGPRFALHTFGGSTMIAGGRGDRLEDGDGHSSDDSILGPEHRAGGKKQRSAGGSGKTIGTDQIQVTEEFGISEATQANPTEFPSPDSHYPGRRG